MRTGTVTPESVGVFVNILDIPRTTFCHGPVAAEAVGPDSVAPEQLRPVHRVVVAQAGVLTDVHAAVADLPEGAQTQ